MNRKSNVGSESSQRDFPVKTCRLPENGRVSVERDQGYFGTLFDLHPPYVPSGWYSKTFPDYCHLARAMDAESVDDFYQSIARESVTAVRDALPRKRRSTTIAGPISLWSLPGWKAAGIGSHTEYWTHNVSDSPNVVVVCGLSAILTRNVPDRFYLTPKGAKGILKRAKKRGREIAKKLRLALTALATWGDSGQSQENIWSQSRQRSQPGTAKRDTEPPDCESKISPISSHQKLVRNGQKEPAGQPETNAKISYPKLVRRLTPTECEILQGFPPGWTVPDIEVAETQCPYLSSVGLDAEL